MGAEEQVKGRTTRILSICTTIPKSFALLREFLPRKNAKNAKAIVYVFAISAFFCGNQLWLRRQPRCEIREIRGQQSVLPVPFGESPNGTGWQQPVQKLQLEL